MEPEVVGPSFRTNNLSKESYRKAIVDEVDTKASTSSRKFCLRLYVWLLARCIFLFNGRPFIAHAQK